jgi:flavin-dependent dehydrogenase
MSYDYQLVVIGSGSGGKDAAILGARAGLRVLLVEKESLIRPDQPGAATNSQVMPVTDQRGRSRPRGYHGVTAKLQHFRPVRIVHLCLCPSANP